MFRKHAHATVIVEGRLTEYDFREVIDSTARLNTTIEQKTISKQSLSKNINLYEYDCRFDLHKYSSIN